MDPDELRAEIAARSSRGQTPVPRHRIRGHGRHRGDRAHRRTRRDRGRRGSLVPSTSNGAYAGSFS